MKGRVTFRRTVVAALVIALAGAAWYYFAHTPSTTTASGQKAPAGGGRHGMRGALPPVQAAIATSESVPRYLSGLGTITAANTVTVRSRVSGQLKAIPG
ncbi:MdtA/MuxA family multidrug efflux RND transporter periplasmic adaptor subunit [Kosakonia cowanii]